MVSVPQIEVHPTREALIQRSRDLVVARIETAIAERGRCTLALAGGSTPKPLYLALAQTDLPWDKLHIFWGDERYVAPDHPDSNAGMAKAAWLDQVAIPPSQIHLVPTHLSPPAAAAAYNHTLQGVLGIETRPDIILLGMGDDGHTASLFPHTAALTVDDHLVTLGDKDGTPRITLTAAAINRSRCVLFLVTGTNKQPALTQVFAEDGDDQAYPSRLIRPEGELWWLLDSDAGAALEGSI
ncbi:6-phosphogluconolactonase [Leptolyngbya sp. PCC 6406]|uniref:6-phosphogluconolactonase n=1 Tax=Leptolyngbya sp. PCC 6406 TaxID=1173264 RepID=UPI0002ABE3AC|nr:6-phosphogluconolactonase [Leptolyngbya sp. PCC 6406]